jgi:hypothetical protein
MVGTGHNWTRFPDLLFSAWCKPRKLSKCGRQKHQMVQQQTTSRDKLFNHMSQQQRGLSNEHLALLLFDHVLGPIGQTNASSCHRAATRRDSPPLTKNRVFDKVT